MSRSADDHSSALLAGSRLSSDVDAIPSFPTSSSTSSSSTPTSLKPISFWLDTHRRLVVLVFVTILLLPFVVGTALYFVGQPDELAAAAPIVKLPQGSIQAAVSGTCATYYSIPFAQPPVGSLRWLPPQAPPPSWSGVRDGSKLPPQCVQPDGGSPTGVSGDEDCLYLNVYTNQSGPTKEPLPVLVFIHGGSSIAGYSAGGLYDHCDLIHSRPIVAVTVNYRLNVFGYLSLVELSQRQAVVTGGSASSGNWGLRDNIAALQWVRDNIGYFGGDPSQVTIYGQSTGGTNVMALYVSPLANGLFRAALSLSSSPVLRGELSTAEQQNADFVTNANCSRATYNDTVACMLALTPGAAWAAAPARWQNSYDLGMPNRSWPDAMVISVDGDVVPAELNTALAAGMGSSSNVTLAFGHCGQEIDFGPMSNVTGYTQAQWEQWLSDNMPALGWNDTVVRALKAAYPISDYDNDAQLTYEMVVNDIIYCGGVNNLRALAGRSSPPPPAVYHHLNDFAPVVPVGYFGPWPSRNAGHAWDLILLLRHWPGGYQGNSTHWGGKQGDELRAETLRRLWVDDLVINGGNRSAGGLWTEFYSQWTGGVEYTARFGREGEVDVLANLRSDKCALLDSLGFAGAAWAN